MTRLLLGLSLALAAPVDAARSAPAKNPTRLPVSVDTAARTAQLDEMRAQMTRSMRALGPLLMKLDALKETYPQHEDPAKVDGVRDPLRGEIDKLLRELENIENDYDKLRHTHDNVAIISLLGGLRERGGSLTIDPELTAAKNRQIFSDKAGEFRRKASDILGADNEAYAALRSAYELRRRRTLLAAGIPILILLAGAVFFWLGRRSRARAAVQVLAGPAPAGPRTPPRAALPFGSPHTPMSAPLARQAAGPTGAPPPFSLPAVVGGNYRLERQLGQDVFGSLYEGIDFVRNRKAVVRHLRQEITRSGADLEAVLGEARQIISLKHPNLVEVYSVIRDGDQAFIAMEPVRGKALADFMMNGQRINLPSTKGLLRQTAAALEYAHGHKVLHRDLKPSNICVGHDGTVKVADFGFSYVARLAVAKFVRNDIWGSEPYMAPEYETSGLCIESDVYSMGIILYEMLAGALPFPGPDYIGQKRALAFPPLSTRVPDLPSAIDVVLRKALQVEVNGRFHTPAELSAAVDALQA
jgi:hypothetical protein